jgi:hypothetical protein
MYPRSDEAVNVSSVLAEALTIQSVAGDDSRAINCHQSNPWHP